MNGSLLQSVWDPDPFGSIRGSTAVFIPTSHEIWTFVGCPLADAPSACKQVAYDGKSKNQTALVLGLNHRRRNTATPSAGLELPFPRDSTKAGPLITAAMIHGCARENNRRPDGGFGPLSCHESYR